MKGVVRSPFYLRFQVPFFFMEKRFTVGYQILQISQLWTVNRGEIGLSDDALENREPDSTASRIGSSNTLFVAGSRPGRPKATLPLRIPDIDILPSKTYENSYSPSYSGPSKGRLAPAANTRRF